MQEPTEDVPHCLSCAAAQMLARFLQNVQQTAHQIQVSQVAHVAPPVRPSIGRHPVKQIEKDFEEIVGRLSPNVQVGQEIAKGGTVAGHVVSGLVETGQQEDELEDVVVEPSLVPFEEKGQRLVAPRPFHLLLGLPVTLHHVDEGLDGRVEALDVRCHGDQAQEDVASADREDCGADGPRAKDADAQVANDYATQCPGRAGKMAGRVV